MKKKKKKGRKKNVGMEKLGIALFDRQWALITGIAKIRDMKWREVICVLLAHHLIEHVLPLHEALYPFVNESELTGIASLSPISIKRDEKDSFCDLATLYSKERFSTEETRQGKTKMTIQMPRVLRDLIRMTSSTSSDKLEISEGIRDIYTLEERLRNLTYSSVGVFARAAVSRYMIDKGLWFTPEGVGAVVDVE